MKPRAVTGLGVVSAVGVGKDSFFQALSEAAPLANAPYRPIESFDATNYPNAHNTVYEVPHFDPTKYLGDKGLRTLDRLTKLLVVAARLVMHDSGFKRDGIYVQSSPERVGICCSNAYGSLEAITELDRVAQLEDARYINPAKFPNTVSNSASGYASIWEDLRALNVSVSDGNCGALDAVACADIYLETKRADALLVGGAEAMSEALYLAFRRLGVVGKGTLLGEGAALFMLEPLEHARARKANVRGEVIGYGTTFHGPEGEELIFASAEAMESAIRIAIADAGVEPSDISVVASSVSGIKAHDDAEIAAISRVLGDVPIAAPKSILGETLGAGGAMGMAAALAWFGGAVPSPIVSPLFSTPSATTRLHRVSHVLVTSIGYYGNASAVVMRAPRA
ncbi:MAG TPA: beta-ketoacyl synthase N-terminal-like domain-containing protein [Polyangiaceae bacterium]|nr:beta-ketoacyl synthase N-terminal-like domain-containing protein [Polyangiaceae bacterium]